jgi:hypothetical protein
MAFLSGLGWESLFGLLRVFLGLVGFAWGLLGSCGFLGFVLVFRIAQLQILSI